MVVKAYHPFRSRRHRRRHRRRRRKSAAPLRTMMMTTTTTMTTLTKRDSGEATVSSSLASFPFVKSEEKKFFSFFLFAKAILYMILSVG